MKEKLKEQNEWFDKCLNIHSEVYYKFFDKQMEHSDKISKEIEETNRNGESGSLLLGGGVEEPHYDIPNIK